jgi:hypothetical protein
MTLTELLLLALVPTIMIEYGVLLLLRERSRKVLLSSVVVNTMTNVPLNLYFYYAGNGWLAVFLGEMLVMIAEGLWYLLLVRSVSQAFTYSVLCNAISFLTGVLFQELLQLYYLFIH